MDVCKICDSEKSGMNHQFPKDHDTALQQTAGDIQNGFCGAEDPGAQDPNLTFETQMLCSQPVLYVNHKQLVQKVCIYVVGDDLGDVGFDFEDLHIRKEMMGVKTESSQMDTKASNGDFDFRFRIVPCFPQSCLKLLGLLVCGPMTNIGPCNQTVRFYTKRETPCYRCLPLFI